MNELSLIPAQRHILLLSALRTEGPLSIRVLAERLGVSHMTVRRDVAELAEAGEVTQIRGGVRLTEGPGSAVPLDLTGRLDLERPRKERIAEVAAERVEDGMCVFLDAGTTMQTLAPLLAGRRDLTVVTTDLAVASALLSADGITSVLAGGTIDPTVRATEGHIAATVAGMHNYDCAFLSSPGWSLSRGLTSPTEGKRELKRAVMQVATRSVLLSDSSKYGNLSALTVCPLEKLDEIICDDGLRTEVRERIRETAVELVVTSTKA
ncbi:DeoR/GlpR family DNA-binding transcription regulator [Brachybacterium paraconglomeratum]|uniref:DeoR/GlpR family DNA-binding transcription regulator n=1 Tax=Brachybacterium paraconglomeratum TaxID=173362 RepID=UPI003FD15575